MHFNASKSRMLYRDLFLRILNLPERFEASCVWILSGSFCRIKAILLVKFKKLFGIIIIEIGDKTSEILKIDLGSFCKIFNFMKIFYKQNLKNRV